ncbi:hypothetical protein J4439_05840 [Candidatus Woesearchaeota archaeon]|nr:hypothetical protein [Candidatus Woesearchaeota archaeon]
MTDYLKELTERFEKATGLDLEFIAESYAKSLGGTEEENLALFQRAQSEGKQKEYQAGMTLERLARSGSTFGLGRAARKWRPAFYAYLAAMSYMSADGLLGLYADIKNRNDPSKKGGFPTLIGLIRERLPGYQAPQAPPAQVPSVFTQPVAPDPEPEEAAPAEEEPDWMDLSDPDDK